MRTIFYMLRAPNLLIIALTFLLLRYLVFLPVYGAFALNPGMGSLNYLLMITATILIAAAGYLGNDYFDVVTDRVNKPQKQYIGIQFTPGSTLAMALILSLFSFILAIWLAVKLHNGLPAILLLSALTVAWWYAIRLKKSLMWGNIAVASMSAGTIAMTWMIENQFSQVSGEPFRIITGIISAITIFAFLLSILREIVKDMEDIDGDRLIGCKSLPIVKGIPFTKVTLRIISVTTLILLLITQAYLLGFLRIWAAIWLLVAVEIPFVYFLIKLGKAGTKVDFHKLSSLLKWIMLGGMGTIVAGQF